MSDPKNIGALLMLAFFIAVIAIDASSGESFPIPERKTVTITVTNSVP